MPPIWGRQKGVTPICSDFPVFIRFAFLVFWSAPICSNLLRFLPICFRTNQNKSGKPLSAGPFASSRKVHASYDWTTGVPDNGYEWRKFRVVPRSRPLRPLVFLLCLIGVETEWPLDYQTAGIISIVRWNLRPVNATKLTEKWRILQIPRKDLCQKPSRPKKQVLQSSSSADFPVLFKLLHIIRAARLQNETALEQILTQHEKRFEKREKRSEKQSETRSKYFSPSQAT